MNFYVVFCKNKKKFDKYIKVNKIKNKIIIDIKSELYDIKDSNKYNDYFNLLIYIKIIQSIKKNKDVYYIPNFQNKNIDINELTKIKNNIKPPTNFNGLMFFDDFGQNDTIFKDMLNILNIFDNSQIIKDY